MLRKTLFALTLVAAFPLPPRWAVAQNSAPSHGGDWPIENGFNRQPTNNNQDVTLDQAREIDRLYDQLLSTGDSTAKERPRLKRAR